MTPAEPVTALTDAVLAAWTALCCALLFARASGRRPVLLWACAFAAVAVSALAGAVFHCCRPLFDPLAATLVWKVVPVTTGVAALCFGWAAALAWLRPAARRVAVAILIAEFIACLVAAAMSNSFFVAAADYVPVLAAILVGCIARWNLRAARLIAGGVVVSFAALAVEASSLRAGPLDHNDIFHVIQMAAMLLLYRGGARL
jgi:hypothetical protein